MRFLSALILCLAFQIGATTYLCAPEAAAGIRQSFDDTYLAGKYQVNTRFILSDQSGKWMLQEEGVSTVLFDYCSSEYICQRSSGFGGAFWRNENNMFSVHMMTSLIDHPGIENLVYSGKCVKQK